MQFGGQLLGTTSSPMWIFQTDYYWGPFPPLGNTTTTSLIKTINGLAIANVKKTDGLDISLVKTVDGLANQ